MNFGSFLCILFTCGGISTASAAEYTLTGHGSAGITYASTDYVLAEFATHGRRTAIRQNSKLGLNLLAEISDRISAQILTIVDGSTPEVNFSLDTAVLSYKLSPEWRFRIGRLRAGVWLMSQQIDVGVSYPWVSPPTEVYSLNPIRSINGLSVFGRIPVGENWFQMELSAGEGASVYYDSRATGDTKTSVVVRDSINAELSYLIGDRFTIRSEYTHARVNGSTVASVGGIDAVFGGAVPGATVQSTTALDIDQCDFFSFGGKAEISNFVVISEVARRLTSGLSFSRATGVYATLGYRVGELLPFFTYSTQFDLVGNQYFHPAYPTVTSMMTSASSVTGGLNYSFSESVAAKFDFTQKMMKFADTAADLSIPVVRFKVDFVF